MEIKYSFAFDRDKNIVSIKDVIDRSTPYYSVDYEVPLIPVMGKIKTHHFRTKPGNNNPGSRESYLHKLAKIKFKQIFEDCLANKTKFTFNQIIDKHCNAFIDKFGFECELGKSDLEYDLTAYFDQCVLENKDQQYIPDLLLKSNKSDHKIYVEIFVTHKCDDSKINSGVRIIEIKIENEEDIQQLEERNLSSNNIRLYNFKKSKTSHENFCNNNCKNMLHYFAVLSNGSCLSKRYGSINNLMSDYSNWKDIISYVKVEPDYIVSDFVTNRKFQEFIIEAHKNSVNVRSCYLCRYHGAGYSKAIFCKFLKKECSSNEAVKCKFYRIDLSK